MIKETTITVGVQRPSFSQFLVSPDEELAIKAMRGIADIDAGRCAPVHEVRERILSRY